MMEVKFGDEIFRLNRNLMIAAGSWNITEDMSPRGRSLYTIYTYIALVIQFGSSVLMLFELWNQIYLHQNLDRALELAITNITVLIILIKLKIYKKSKVVELVKQGIKETNEYSAMNCKIRDIILKQINYCNSINRPIITLTIGTGLFLIIFTIFQAQQYKTNNMVKDFPTVFFNPLNNYFFLFVHIQNVSALYYSVLNCALQSLLNTIIMNVVTQIKVLRYQFMNYDRSTDKGNNYTELRGIPDSERNEMLILSKLKIIIQKQNKLIRYTDDLNKAITNALLIEYMVSSFTIAFIVITIAKGENVLFYSMVLIATTFQLCIYCLNAHEIIFQSMNLGKAIYNSNWYERSKRIKSTIFIIILRSRMPLALTIGHFGPITAQSMISICKVAHSYLSVFSRSK